MKNVAKLNVELTVEERNLLSIGYKNVVGAHRASWRILSSIEQKEEAKGNDVNVKRIKVYRQKVESELSNICSDIMTIIDDHLIPSSSSAGESSVFFYKMKGDYYRYMAEFKTGDERKEVADHSMEAYQVCLYSQFLCLCGLKRSWCLLLMFWIYCCFCLACHSSLRLEKFFFIFLKFPFTFFNSQVLLVFFFFFCFFFCWIDIGL